MRRSNSRPIRLLETCLDNTEPKRAEEALRLSEQRYRSLVEATAAIVWTMPVSGVVESKQSGWEAFTGLSTDECLGRGWLESIHPDDRERTAELWSAAVAARAPYQIEHRVRRHDGEYRNVLNRAVPIFAENGELREWFGICIDITNLKQAEEKLRDSEHRWRSLTETLPQLVWTATPDGACDYFSSQWTQHTGVPESQLLGWQWLEALHPDDREPTRRFWTDSVAGRGAYDVEYRVRRWDGEYRWFKTRGVPIRDSQGGIFKWFGTCTDITDGKMAEEELRLAKDAAESANRAKDEFLANVSHEVRTPLNAILGMADLTLDTPLADEQRRYLKTVKSAGENLLDMINDLLDFSKIAAGKIELDPTDFSARAVLADTLRVLAVRGHRKGLELVSHVQADVPDALIGDAGRLRQVLLNLVGNAIKFTDAGEVVVRLEVAAEPASNGGIRLQFTIRDSGIGISKERQLQIFRAFEQEDTSTTRKYGGTGLGLTIAARLVELMDGTIAVNSEPGKGSTFVFTAAFGRPANAPQAAATRPPASLHDLPVLVVDDNAASRRILEEWLRGWQMEPTAVGDAMAAMDAVWNRSASGRPYALVLLDARMAGTDGLTVAAKIRERAELATTRIILLGSEEWPGDLARARELRIDAHLLKPVQQHELLETICQVLSRASDDASITKRPAGDEEPATATDSAALPMNILVAEDNDLSAQVIQQMLSRQGHRVQLTNNGREALALAEHGHFDLLLLDIHMPELDGFQVVQAIREREQTTAGHLTVIALTARSRKEDRERCLAAGMDEFLTKPIRPVQLWAAIDRVMTLHLAHFGLLDVPVLLSACGGDANLLEKMCQSFQTRVPEHLTALRNALRDQDAPRLREAAHKFCGLLSEFSTVAGDRAGNLEDAAARATLYEAQPLLEELEAMANDLVQVVRGFSLANLHSLVNVAGGSES